MPGATIGENCVILEGSLVEAKATVLPGSVVPPGRRVPAGQIWGGNPVEYVGENDPEHGNEGVVETEVRCVGSDGRVGGKLERC